MEGSLEEQCIFNRSGKCYFIESEISNCSLCFNFKTFHMYGTKRKLYYNLFDYLKDNKLDRDLFPDSNNEQDSLKDL